MSRTLNVVRMQLANRETFVWVPLLILGLAISVPLIVAGAAGAMLAAAGTLLQRMTGNPMASPEVMMALQLLLADARNLREQVQQWHARTVEPFAQSLDRVVRRGMQEGTLRQSVVMEYP